MTDSIFAGKLSLTGDAPDQAPLPSPSPAEQARRAFEHIKSTAAPYEPLPEPTLSGAAQRVREEARRLGIDYDAEVAKVLHRMRANGLQYLPGPYNKTSGPDPVADASDRERLAAEYAAAELLRRKHDL